MIEPYYQTSMWICVLLGWLVTIRTNTELRNELVKLKTQSNENQ
jgi:hypothetical protein